MDNSISYGICVCNEREEIERLLNQLFKFIKKEDEIIVQIDSQHTTNEVKDFLEKVSVECAINKINFHRIFFPLNNDFASFKNNLIEHCTKSNIFQLDADELIHENLLENIHLVLQNNDVDVILVPRENYTEGLTKEYCEKWGWNVDEKGRNNFPDFQYRIFKNLPEIRFRNKVHEILDGYKSISHLPYDVEGWCLLHYKTIEKQIKQNNFYNNI